MSTIRSGCAYLQTCLSLPRSCRGRVRVKWHRYNAVQDQRRGAARPTPGVWRNDEPEARAQSAATRQAMHDFFENDLAPFFLSWYEHSSPTWYRELEEWTLRERLEALTAFVCQFNTFARDPGSMQLRPLRQTSFGAFLDGHLDLHIDDINLAMRFFYSQERKIRTRDLGIQLKQYMSAAGYINFVIISLIDAWDEHKLGRRDALRTPQVLEERRRLRTFIARNPTTSSDALWHEGHFLEAEKNFVGAFEYYDRLLTTAFGEHRMSANTNSAPKSKSIGTHRREGTIPLTNYTAWRHVTPWREIFRISQMAVRERLDIPRDKLFKSLASAVKIGLELDDSQANFTAARMKQGEHFQYEHGIIGREATDIGKSSKWLFYMTKAASSAIPEAAAELGDFYWKTTWPYLDDEPPWHIKPTPFDRYPSTSSDESTSEGEQQAWTKKLQRIAQALGLSEAPPGPDDMFHTAHLPNKSQDRVRLARDWYMTAAEATFAPALRGLLEISSSPMIPRNLSCPKSAMDLRSSRYLASSSEEYDRAFAHEDDTRASEAKRGSSRADDLHNPFYNELDAKDLIGQALTALEARQIWLDLAKNRSRAGHRNPMMTNFAEAVKGRKDGESLYKWVKYDHVFETWVHDEELCEALSNSINQVRKKFNST